MADPKPAHTPGEPEAWFAVIGGGRSQLPFVEAAARLGYRTLVFDRDPDAPAKRHADRFVPCSTHDAEHIVEVCEQLHAGESGPLRGCIAYSSAEGALLSGAALAEALGLRGAGRKAIGCATSKHELKKALDGAEIPTPPWRRLRPGESLAAFLERHGKAVLKPTRGGAGSAGVTLLQRGEGEAEGVVERIAGRSSDGTVLAEAWAEGREYSVDGYVEGGEARTLAVSRKYGGSGGRPFVIEGFSTGDVPVELSDELKKLAKRVVSAAGMEHSFFSVDVIRAEGALQVVDLGPLLDAKMDRLIWHAGFDVYELGVALMAGRLDPDRREPGDTPGNCALRFLYAEQEGTLTGANPGRHRLPGAEGAGGAFRLEMEKRVPSDVGPPRSLSDMLGWICYCEEGSASPWRRVRRIAAADYLAVE